MKLQKLERKNRVGSPDALSIIKIIAIFFKNQNAKMDF